MRSSKTISFNECVSVHTVPERSTKMTPMEKFRVYYSKDEMRNFQLERKQICNEVIEQARSLSKLNPAVSPAKNVSLILKSNASLRGFEAVLCPARKNNKTKVLNAVRDYQYRLKASKSSFSAEQKEMALAELYSKLSYWSEMLALLTARNDRLQLYELDAKRNMMSFCGSHISSETRPISISFIVPSAKNIKNINSVIEEQHQRKRWRLY